MKYLIKLVFIFLVSLLVFSFKPTDRSNSDHVQGELMVLLNPHIQLDSESIMNRLMADFSEIDFEPVQLLSKRMDIWLVQFNPQISDDKEVLLSVRKHEYVQLAQFNHFIEMRDNTPNDPYFYQQWNFKNTGQMGGVEDADIDATEVWDINTGGVAITGDTMIVAVVDGGCDLDHPDLNLWKNYHEIPLNGIDDDNNGYVDDYDGWNAYNNTPAIFDDDHGTHVTGIVAARTDNLEGVAGLNWHAKVYPIAGSSTIEATVVNAYGYVLEMRSLYNETQGAKGAFIVASNSSFGVNQGQPEDYPIWGAMYDSMGMAGILSAAATANANWNIDEVGDVPTAFPSDYLVSVTSTTRMDEKTQNAGYGATTIDLGAPGQQVYSTKYNGSYGFKSGTSMASPHVAGAAAYLLSAADAEFINNYKSNPAEYILKIKQYIMDGIDPLPTLEGVTVTGGRLNLWNSLFALQNPPILQVTPDSIIMTIEQYYSDSTMIFMENVGGSPLNYWLTVEDSTAWVSLNKNEGTIEKFEQDSVQVTLSAANLNAGTYYTHLLITYNYYNYDTIPVKLTVTPYINISEHLKTMNEVSLFPNPFSEEFYIEADMNYPDVLWIEIFDAGGRKVSTIGKREVSGGKNLIRLTTRLDRGSYYCRVSGRNETLVKKLICY